MNIVLPDTFWVGVVASLIYGPMGILMLLLGFLLFDKILPKVDFQALMTSDPKAMAIVVAAFLLGLAHIVASVVH